MFITHIYNKGHAFIPVLLENARRERKVANYPEFVKLPEDYTFNMIYRYVDVAHIKRVLITGDTLLAKELYRQFIAQDQYSWPMNTCFWADLTWNRKITARQNGF